MRKSIEDILNELKKEKEQSIIYELPKEVDNEEPVTEYTKESLEENLFKDNTSDFISDFELVNPKEPNDLLYVHINRYASESTGVEIGNYIAEGLGSMESLTDDEDMELQNMEGRPVPRKHLETSAPCRLLFKVNDSEEQMTQQELVQSINKGLDVKPMDDEEEEFIFTSNLSVEYLEVVDKDFFNNRIDETLKRYKDIDNPNEVLERNLKYKELLTGNTKMVFCSILDKEVYVFEGDN